MRNKANENRASERVATFEARLQSVCHALNDPQQPERRDALRALVKRWLAVGSLKQMTANDPDLWNDVSEAWNPYFTHDGSGATWGVSLKTTVPATAEEWATEDFALLMLNPLRDRLRGPCPRCQSYYIKKRNTKIYCSKKCGNAASASRSNAAFAKDERKALRKSAAKFWPQWTERKHPNRSFWIAGRVNGSHVRVRTKTGWKPARTITRKWVSRNAVKIARGE